MSTIFLSSTYLELLEYRQMAHDAIVAYQHACVWMEDFPPSDWQIEEFCRRELGKCDVVLLLLGRLYGTNIPGRDISYTEHEFDAAVAAGRKVLVFEPTPQAATDIAGALARNGLDRETQQRRQEQFAKKVLRGQLPRLFKDPADLKFRVGQALATLPAQPVRHAGERIPYLCNRSLQIGDFGDAFRSSPAGQPIVYVVHGHELEQHTQCVQRLICRHITYPKRAQTTAVIAPADKNAVIRWPVEADEAPILFNRLCRDLFLALNPDATFQDGYGADAFCRLAVDAGVSHVRFRHMLRPQRWDAGAQALWTTAYLPFLKDVGARLRALCANDSAPRVLIFFEFKHGLTGDDAKAFGDGLVTFFGRAENSSGVTCRVLPQLDPVTLDDLDMWYESFSDYLLAPYRTEAFSTLFEQPPLHMIEVEHRLRQLVGLEDYGQ